MAQTHLDDLCINIVEVLLQELKNNKDKALITYGDLSNRLKFNINPRNLDNPLVRISDFCKENGMPLLSTMVVNKDKYIPGTGYFKYYYPNAITEEYYEIFKRELKKVRSYNHWNELENLLGINIAL